jgi:hypothetical protein
MEFSFMISGNGVPAATDCDEGTGVRDSQQVRDIQNLIDKLAVVNRQLSLPLRARPVPWPEDAGAGVLTDPEQPEPIVSL